MKTVVILCLISTFLFTASALAVTGNQLKECSEAFFEGYVVGATDGVHFGACIPEGVTNDQVYEVVRKYLKDHPEELHLHAVTLIKKAFIKAWPCK
jgi:hypothetical protein